jgi:long-chain acyl-CoA synthetase
MKHWKSSTYCPILALNIHLLSNLNQENIMSKTDLVLEKFYHFEKTRANEVYLKQPLDGKWVEFTWSEAGTEARKLAQKIKDMNLEPKSCIALLSKNCAHWIISDLAILMSGHISVPLYPTLHKDTIEYVLDHCDAKLVIVGKLDDWEKQKAGISDKYTKVSFPMWQNSDTQTWNSFIGDTKPMTENYNAKPEEISTMIYTSGTTGKPKGVVHTFESMSLPMANALKVFDMNSNDRFFSYLPLAHVAERLLIEIGSIFTGGTVSFAESLDTFKDNLVATRPTLFLAVPRIWSKFQQGILHKLPQKKLNLLLSIPIIGGLIKKKVCTGLGLDQVKYCFTGAAAISPDILSWFNKLGIEIQDVYGMTENFGITTMNHPGKIRIGTAGTKFGSTSETKIGDNGEILTRSPANMQCYYKNPEESAQTIDSDGWLHTGDKGQISSDGYLSITGRVKDLFKTSKGKYVAPNAIESHFAMCELVEQVCVVGDGMPQPLGLVVLSDFGKNSSKDELSSALNILFKEVNGKIENFERLKNLVVLDDEWSVDTGILTPTLKIKRNVVEDKYAPKVEGWYESSDVILYS